MVRSLLGQSPRPKANRLTAAAIIVYQRPVTVVADRPMKKAARRSMSSAFGVRWSRKIVVAAFLCWPGASAWGQSPGTGGSAAPTEPIVRVTVDLAARAFDRVLPFDVPFFIVGTAPEGTVGLTVQYTNIPESGLQSSPVWQPPMPVTWQADPPTSNSRTFVVFVREPLEAKRAYRFRFAAVKQPTADQLRRFRDHARTLLEQRLRKGDAPVPAATAREIQRELAADFRSVVGVAQWEPGAGSLLEPTGSSGAFLSLVQQGGPPWTPQSLTQLADQIALGLRDERLRGEEIDADGGTPRNPYVSADAGLLYAGDIATGALYIGSNIYFRPVNKRAPLSQKGSWGRRVAVTIGFTVTSMADENERTRSDLFANQSLVLGAGMRLTRSIGVGAGALVFKESNPNPLIAKKSAATTPYLSFSFDLDVARLFERLGW
jgi:hypothetical protein